jgi:hypothetical protein
MLLLQQADLVDISSNAYRIPSPQSSSRKRRAVKQQAARPQLAWVSPAVSNHRQALQTHRTASGRKFVTKAPKS